MDILHIKKIRNRVNKGWGLSINALLSILEKQLNQAPGELFEKILLLDFFHRYLSVYKNRFRKKGGFVIKGRKKDDSFYGVVDSKYQIVHLWVLRKKIALEKELYLTLYKADLELKEWEDPDYEMAYIKKEICRIKNELENESFPDSSKNPLYPINELFKSGRYPDLFEVDINSVVTVVSWISYNRYLKERLNHLENKSSYDEVTMKASIKAEKDTLGNITLNFPLRVLMETAQEMVKKEQEKPLAGVDNMLPVLLTRKETAKLLRVSLQTLSAWTKQGRIQAERIGNKQIRFRKENVEKVIQEIKTIKFHN